MTIKINDAVIEILELIYSRHLCSKEAWHRILKKYSSEIKFSRVVTGKVHWILKYQYFLDFIINSVLKGIKVENLNLKVRAALEVATFEILLRNVPPPLATDSVIKGLKRFGCYEHINFVFSIMKQIEKINVEELLNKIEDEELRLCIKNSFPYEMYKRIKEEWGEIAKKLVEYSLKPPVDYIRVNLIKTDPDKLRKKLEEKGFQLEETEFFDVFKVKFKPIPLIRTEEYKEGLFSIQDLASCSVAHYLNPQPDDFIVDLTAAPGNKTFHVYSLTEGKAKILAIDIDPERIKRMKREMKRLGIKNIEIKCMDAKELKDIKADIAIVDPTCSSSGTFQKYPEIKVFWKHIEKLLPSYIEEQKALLKKGLEIAERVSYSVCSVLKSEGENVVRSFDVKIEKERRFWPWEETVGFYVCILSK